MIAAAPAAVGLVAAPRAIVAAAPLVRAVGWLLTETGGRWSGSTEALWAEVIRLTPDDGDRARLGANASTFGRLMAWSGGSDLAAAGIRVAKRRSVVDGRDLRRWTLSSPEILASARPADPILADFWSDCVEQTGDGAFVSTTDLYEAHVHWAAWRGIEAAGAAHFRRRVAPIAVACGARPAERPCTAVACGRVRGWAGIRFAPWVREIHRDAPAAGEDAPAPPLVDPVESLQRVAAALEKPRHMFVAAGADTTLTPIDWADEAASAPEPQ